MASRDPDPAASSSWLNELDDDAAFAGAGLPARGQVVGGKYRIEALIGRGGMGVVYSATHVLMDKPVAVKWLFPDFASTGDTRQRFLHEARAAARIRHPSVVDVYDVGEENGALYMVMELLEGESFEALIKRGRIAIPELLQLLTQAMRGVAAAHAKGIVHRDIKPENIFIVADPTQPSGRSAKVLDFGVSKLGDEARRNPGLTKSGVVMGTPLYMSLEQMNGARDVDARTDIYAFGVILYRALTGHLPFHGDTFAALAVAVATHTPTAPRALRAELPQALSDLVMKAIARRRDDRYPSVDALLEDLRAMGAASGQLSQVTPPSPLPLSMTPVSRERLRADALPLEESAVQPTPRSTPQPARRSALWIALALLGVVAALAAALWSRRDAQPAPLPPAPIQAEPGAAPPAKDLVPVPGPVVEEQAEDWEKPAEDLPGALPAQAPMSASGAAAPAASDPTPPGRSDAHGERSARGAKPEAKRSPSTAAPIPIKSAPAAAAPTPAPAPSSPPAAADPGKTKPEGTSHRSGGVQLEEL